MINYGKQYIDNSDIRAVKKVLRSDYLTQGPLVEKVENSLKHYFSCKYANVVSSGTAALHLLAIAYKFGKNDLIITSPNTFLASSNSAIYTGAKVDFADIDQLTYNLDPEKLEYKIKKINIIFLKLIHYRE